MQKKLTIIIIIVLALLVVGAGAFVLLQDDQKSSLGIGEKKAPHFESSTPASNTTLAAVPPNVTIDFNFDLATGSSIDIFKDDKNYTSGETKIDENKLAMRRDIPQDAPDGTYTVKYKACWPDGSCHDGQFSFKIDRTLQTGYLDLTNQKEVTIRMSQIKFSPMEVKISKGTKVTWINDDAVTHYVNTDAHPSHTHVLELNSKALNKGDSYSYTFDKTGAFPYHCSAHASSMTASIVVI